jgi:hypothetical protein
MVPHSAGWHTTSGPMPTNAHKRDVTMIARQNDVLAAPRRVASLLLLPLSKGVARRQQSRSEGRKDTRLRNRSAMCCSASGLLAQASAHTQGVAITSPTLARQMGSITHRNAGWDGSHRVCARPTPGVETASAATVRALHDNITRAAGTGRSESEVMKVRSLSLSTPLHLLHQC